MFMSCNNPSKYTGQDTSPSVTWYGVHLINITLQLLINFSFYKPWPSKKYLTGPKDQYKTCSWHEELDKDFEQLKTSHDLFST